MRAGALLLTVLVVAGTARAGQQQQTTDTQYTICAPNEQCVYWPYCYEGVLNSGGIGLIDPRSPVPIPGNITAPRPCDSVGKLCCVDPDYDPGTDIDNGLQASCPLHHACVPQPQCIDGEINTSGIGLINPRIGGCGKNDVCCKRPPPLPLLTCPSPDQTCRPSYECQTSSGVYEGDLSCYVDANAGVDGVCCLPPVVSQCSRGRVCVTNQQCTDQGTVNTDGAGNIDVRFLDRCNVDGGATGVCCLEPPPPVNPPVEKCSQPNTACSPTSYCNQEDLSAPNGYTETCYRTEGSGTVGECCLQAPLLTCPVDHTCNLAHQCAETPSVLAGKPSCQLNTELVGVCCTKKSEPLIVVDVCPKNSVCLPEALCQGNPQTNVVSTHCRLSGTGYSNPGVCCANTITDTETPNVLCGVGSPDIDTRIKSTNLLHRQAKFAEFPWMGIVFFRNQTYKCGATVVDDRWVLTAAHCVSGFTPYDLRVRLGEYQVDVFDTAYPYEDYDLVRIVVHPDFNPKNLHNDVAVLELSTPIKYRHHINRICLPPVDRVYPDGTECIATGWGKDAFDGGKFQVILKKVSLPVVTYGLCQELLRKTRLGRFFKLDKSFVCAGGKADQDACTGDGGGPLMCLNPTTARYELYGMTAWGVGCGVEGNPGVYVNVPYFIDWVYGISKPTPDQILQHSAGPYDK